MSAQFAIAQPRRIKATHRRRRKIAAGPIVQRYYDPAIGRVLSVDPMAVDTTTAWNFNRYNYANDNPYRFTDPDGRQSIGSSGQLVRVLNEQVAPGLAKIGGAIRDAAPRITSAIVGTGEVVVGAATVLTGLGAGALGSDDAGPLVAAGGSVMFMDGVTDLQNAYDGGSRHTVVGDAFGMVAGERGAEVGDLLSAGASGKSAVKAVMEIVETGAKKAIPHAVVEAASTVKAASETPKPKRPEEGQ